MKPYYSENGITIYHGDARDVLPRLKTRGTPPYVFGQMYDAEKEATGEG